MTERVDWPQDGTTHRYRELAVQILAQWDPPVMAMARFEKIRDLIADGLYRSNDRLLAIVSGYLSDTPGDPVRTVDILRRNLTSMRVSPVEKDNT